MVSVPEWVPVQLPCNHRGVAKAPWTSETIQCVECQLIWNAPFAVESREWKVSCTHKRCPVGKYFGQSHSEAKRFAVAHRNRKGFEHPCSVQYQFNPVTKGCISAAWGRKVRSLIMEGVIADPGAYAILAAKVRGNESDEPPF